MSDGYADFLSEVEGALLQSGSAFKPARISYTNSNHIRIAEIPSKTQSDLLRAGYSFSNKPHTEQRKIWNYIWRNTEYFEVMSQPLIYFCNRRKSLTLSDWSVLRSWSSRIDNWAHGDTICSLYSQLHEEHPKTVFPQLEKWNHSRKPWLRRLSIVSLYYYSELRKKQQPPYHKSKKLVLNLMNDDHIYVQKAVGWTLREMYNVEPRKTYDLLKQLAPSLTSTAWPAATEKLSKKDKDLLKKIRGKISR